MNVNVPQDLAIAALEAEWRQLDELLSGLTDEQWLASTPLPGWRVKDVVAHLIGTESMLLGDAAPEVEIPAAAHVRNDIGRFNEQWVVSMAAMPAETILARFRQCTAERLAVLRSMDTNAWGAEGFTPAGKDTYGRFMRIRVFDCWLHEQDIRVAVDWPGGDGGAPVELALDEMAVAMGFVVGKRAAAPPGSRVALELTGAAGRTINVEREAKDDARAVVVDELSGPATVTVRMPVGVFARLAGGRAEPGTLRDHIEIDGDAELGERIASNLAYTI
ncbi:MAG: maleylpyruvate isomerase family mycothiol-dependent enzyme [Ilumatobacteraceae bacterium]